MVGLRRLSSAGQSLPRHTSREKLLRKMSSVPDFDSIPDTESASESESDVESHVSAQAGVKKLEATASLWSKWSLIFAYAG